MKTKFRVCIAALSLLLALTLLASAWITPALAAPPRRKAQRRAGPQNLRDHPGRRNQDRCPLERYLGQR